jgi:arylsulfatase A-like enzyme
VDLFPTLCDLTGVPRPETAQDGFTLAPVFRGETERVREDVFCEFFSPEEPSQELRHTQRAIRTERWKLTWFPLIGRYQLFDVRDDPYELVDLLLPWRQRRRRAVESGAPVWTRDAWAGWDPRPAYTQAEIEAAGADLHRRMLARMEEYGDPLLAQGRPPEPL